MYSGNYYSDEGHIKIPENYSGTSMLEDNDISESAPALHIEIPKAETKVSPKETDTAEEVFFNSDQKRHDENHNEKEKGFDISTLLRGFGIKDIHFGNIIPKIGTEELLLIGLAAFLLFSKNGDKECALLVFLLIFIK